MANSNRVFRYSWGGVSRNPEIDWFVITDNEQPNGIPRNMHWIKSNLEAVEIKACEKLKCDVSLKRPYKLCDLKPVYGLIFDDIVSNYEYWGYGDFDVIYGDLWGYLNKIEFQKYDKINRWGHCTIIRNNHSMNHLPFSSDSLLVADTFNILKTDRNYGFDERAYNDMCWKNGKTIYVGPFAADIDCFYDRMKCVDRKTMEKICKVNNVTYAPINYKKQIFALFHGKVFRIAILGKRIIKEEFAYIHFRAEIPIFLKNSSSTTYIISRNGFIDVNDDELNDQKTIMKLIECYNKFKLSEILEHNRIGEILLKIYSNSRFLKKLKNKVIK